MMMMKMMMMMLMLMIMMIMMLMMLMMVMKKKMMMMMMRRPSSLRVRAKPRHLPYIYIHTYTTIGKHCSQPIWGESESCLPNWPQHFFPVFFLGRYFLKTGVYTQDIYSVYYVTKISMMGPTVNILQWSYSMLRNTVFLAPRRRETMLQCSGGLGRVLHQLQNVASLLWRADRRC